MELTSLNGLDVYTTKGKYVGRVDDIVLDPNERKISGIAIGSVNKDLFEVNAKGVVIPYRWITAVGDIVLMRQIESKKVKGEKTEEGSKKA
jgi:sporulation protein YlmC with PRC-barrel domain